MMPNRLRRSHAAVLPLWFAACAGAPEAPPLPELQGGWQLVKVCQYDVPAQVRPCSPVTTPVEWLRFEADGTARETGPNGASGRYVVDSRDLGRGRTETLLTIGGRNMGQLGFQGDTLLLGMSYVDGEDRYFVRVLGMVPSNSN